MDDIPCPPEEGKSWTDFTDEEIAKLREEE